MKIKRTKKGNKRAPGPIFDETYLNRPIKRLYGMTKSREAGIDMSVFDRFVKSQTGSLQSTSGDIMDNETPLKRSGTMDRTIMDAYNFLSIATHK